MTTPSPTPDPRPFPHRARSLTLLGLSVLLVLFILAQLSFTSMIALIISEPSAPPRNIPGTQTSLLAVLTIWSALIIPASLLFQFFFLRFLRRRATGWIMLLVAYVGVKIFCWAVANGIGFFALACCAIFRSFWPFWIFSGLSILFMLINLPLGHPLKPFSPTPPKTS